MEDFSQIFSLLEANKVDLKPYIDIREHLHQNPELSTKEAQTASTILQQLKKIGISQNEIHNDIGSHGIAAVIRNGTKESRTIMLRVETDALPLKERTNFPFASHRTQEDSAGVTQPVMHACGHDIHTAALLGTAEKLLHLRDQWIGTVILLFQPAEEKGTGAQAMLEDGLYKRVPVPDLVFGQHANWRRAGYVGVRLGPWLTASESYKITFTDRGGHGAMPYFTIDPVVMACSAVTRLQSIVARGINTDTEMAVVTVGTFHAGVAENIIPETAELKVNIRAQTEDILHRVVNSMKRIVRAETSASGALKEPTFELISSFPSTINDAELVSTPFSEVFSKSFDANTDKSHASDDFSRLATSVGKPYVFWSLGATDPEEFDKAEEQGNLSSISKNHMPTFAPVTQPTLGTGVDAFCTAVLAFLGSGKKIA